MNRARVFGLVFGVLVVFAAFYFLPGRGGKSTAPGDGGASTASTSTIYTGGHPTSSQCTPSCDLTNRAGVVKTFEDAHGKPVPDGRDCEYINSNFPRVVPFGGYAPDGSCRRVGTLYGCCFTDDPRGAMADALSLLGWSSASFVKKVELVEGWIRWGIYGLTVDFPVIDRQDLFEAKLLLGHDIEPPKALPTPGGGMDLKMWIVVRAERNDAGVFIDDYSRWEYEIGPDGSLLSEKLIDHTEGRPH